MVRMILTVFIFIAAHHAARAGIINPDVFTGSPNDSWRYSEIVGAGVGDNPSFFVTDRNQFSSASFRGYVSYDPTISSPPHGWFGNGFDSIQVFSTFILSTETQSIPIRIDGDDGHSLFIDEAFIGGAGFAIPVNYTLDLQANVARKVELVGFNGPGDWSFGIGLPSAGTSAIGQPLDSTPAVRINADGIFSNPAVPEPGSLILVILSCVGFISRWSRLRST